jgi:hypothetical protein
MDSTVCFLPICALLILTVISTSSFADLGLALYLMLLAGLAHFLLMND